MNSRLKLISERSLEIKRQADGDTTAITVCSDGCMSIAGYHYDDEALRALLDVINSKLATGSFAALADTSAVPVFVGKQVRTRDGYRREVVAVLDGVAHCIRADGVAPKIVTAHDASCFVPLIDPTPPAPKRVKFSDLASGQSFRIADKPTRVFTKHVLPPLGNECSTDEEFGVYFFKNDTMCLMEDE